MTLRARTVLPMQGPPLDGGWVRVEHGRIVALGRRSPPRDVLDLGDVLLLPGLVNPHTHLEFSSIPRPIQPLDAAGLAGWIPAVVAARRGGTPDDRAAAITSGLAESAAAGVTLMGEIATASPAFRYPSDGVPRLRVFHESLGLSGPRGQQALNDLARRLDRRHGPLSGLSPHAPYSVAAGLARRLIREAVRRRLPVAVHLAESRDEARLITSGDGPLHAMLAALGAWPEPPPRLLSAADWITLATRAHRAAFIHATFLDEVAFARLVRHRDRAAVVVCPRTASLISGSLAPVRRLLDAGIRVAIGTDGRGSAPDLAPLREASELVDRRLVSPEEALSMITSEAAWAIGCDHTAGRLATGRPADLAVLKPSAWSADPYADALAPSTRVTATLRQGQPIALASTARDCPAPPFDREGLSRATV